MNIAVHINRVDRLTSDLVTMRTKLAGEQERLAAAEAKARRAAEGLSRAKTDSQIRAKNRDLDREQKAAAGQQKKVADAERAIARKQRELSAAQSNLERTRSQQQKREDQAAERRRKIEVKHIEELERRRRSLTALPESTAARASQHAGRRWVRRYLRRLPFLRWGAARLRRADRPGPEGGGAARLL